MRPRASESLARSRPILSGDSARRGLNQKTNLTLVTDANSLHVVGCCLSRQVYTAIAGERNAVASLFGERLCLFRKAGCATNRISDGIDIDAEFFRQKLAGMGQLLSRAGNRSKSNVVPLQYKPCASNSRFPLIIIFQTLYASELNNHCRFRDEMQNTFHYSISAAGFTLPSATGEDDASA